MLTSFPEPVHAVIVGHSGGIGNAFVQALLDDPAIVHITAGARRLTPLTHEKLTQQHLDLTDEATIQAFAHVVAEKPAPRLILIATGLLHDDVLQPEKNMRMLDGAKLQRSFAINVIGPALLGKHLLPLLPRTGKSVFAALSARVSSISDNRLGGWHGYRAAKAALNMMIRNFSIELAPRWPETVCVGLHPGTVDTNMSMPFQANVPPGKLFSPAQAAGYLLGVIETLTPAQSGLLLGWDGREISF